MQVVGHSDNIGAAARTPDAAVGYIQRKCGADFVYL